MLLHTLLRLRIKILCGLALVVFLTPINFVVAQNTTTRVLELSPFLLDLDVEKGRAIASSIDITNRSTQDINIKMQARDFLPGEDGQPQFVPDNQINDESFSLASWIKLPLKNTFILKAGETKKIDFTVEPPLNAEQGTHYGAVLFSYSGADLPAGVEVTQAIGTIILIKYGEARSVGSADTNTNKKFLWWPGKIEVSNKFTNLGNVHVQPKGELYVKNMWGKVVATDFYNKDAANILPKSDRTFVAKWYPSSFAFGRYKLESVLVFGRERLESREVQYVWILPIYLLALVFMFLGLIFWFVVHGRHWHKRRIISKHLN